MATKKQPRDLTGLIRTKAKKEKTVARAAPSKGQTSTKKLKGFLLRPEAAVQFDVLKAETGMKGPDLIAEALNLLFEKYGKPPIA